MNKEKITDKEKLELTLLNGEKAKEELGKFKRKISFKPMDNLISKEEIKLLEEAYHKMIEINERLYNEITFNYE